MEYEPCQGPQGKTGAATVAPDGGGQENGSEHPEEQVDPDSGRDAAAAGKKRDGCREEAEEVETVSPGRFIQRHARECFPESNLHGFREEGHFVC
ncbi:MAG: hypothetical protein BWY59_01367 [Verrucomicrobia bacterium ADurb.Bin345]|nr:MAG: hypothetical protein BWY59_01367 [Verrucomicrobia bacterium ADurb.Bin345]